MELLGIRIFGIELAITLGPAETETTSLECADLSFGFVPEQLDFDDEE